MLHPMLLCYIISVWVLVNYCDECQTIQVVFVRYTQQDTVHYTSKHSCSSQVTVTVRPVSSSDSCVPVLFLRQLRRLPRPQAELNQKTEKKMFTMFLHEEHSKHFFLCLFLRLDNLLAPSSWLTAQVLATASQSVSSLLDETKPELHANKLSHSLPWDLDIIFTYVTILINVF